MLIGHQRAPRLQGSTREPNFRTLKLKRGLELCTYVDLAGALRKKQRVGRSRRSILRRWHSSECGRILIWAETESVQSAGGKPGKAAADSVISSGRGWMLAVVNVAW